MRKVLESLRRPQSSNQGFVLAEARGFHHLRAVRT